MKIKTILLSRFKKKNTQSFVRHRRRVCHFCSYNSKNTDNISLKNKVLKLLSDFYSAVVFSKGEDLGQCTHKDCGCDIYYKTQEKVIINVSYHLKVRKT